MSKKLLVVAVIVMGVSALALGGGALELRLTAPNYKTEFLIDASLGPPGTAAQPSASVAASLNAAAGNAAGDDALALRRFGGRCGSASSTAQLVGFGTHDGSAIEHAAAGASAAGVATLEEGLTAAIADFGTGSPIEQKARRSNRIVVITGHAADACDQNLTLLDGALRDRVRAAGLTLEFRFIGLRVPDDQQLGLLRLATITGAPPPALANTQKQLDAAVSAASLPVPPAPPPTAAPAATAPPPPLLYAASYQPLGSLTGPDADETITIADLDGRTRASTSFPAPLRPQVPDAGAVLQPNAHTAAGRVFYVDRGGVVRSLGPDQTISLVTRFPLTDRQQWLAFAVSPDGKHLIASILTGPPYVASTSPDNPFGDFQAGGHWYSELWVADAGSPSHSLGRHDLGTTLPLDGSTTVVGWDSSGPIATTGANIAAQDGFLGLGLWYGKASHLDRAGNPGPVIGGPDCVSMAETANSVVLCVTQSPSYELHGSARSATGSALFSTPANDPLYLSLSIAPDGSRIAYDTGALTDYAARVAARDGTVVELPSGFSPRGWLDSTTIIGVVEDPNGLSAALPLGIVRLGAPGKVVQSPIVGDFVGVVQGAG